MSKDTAGLLTISQAAAQLGIHANTLRGWADRGLIDCVKLPSGYRRFSQDEVDRLRSETGLERVESKAAA